MDDDLRLAHAIAVETAALREHACQLLKKQDARHEGWGNPDIVPAAFLEVMAQQDQHEATVQTRFEEQDAKIERLERIVQHQQEVLVEMRHLTKGPASGGAAMPPPPQVLPEIGLSTGDHEVFGSLASPARIAARKNAAQGLQGPMRSPRSQEKRTAALRVLKAVHAACGGRGQPAEVHVDSTELPMVLHGTFGTLGLQLPYAEEEMHRLVDKSMAQYEDAKPAPDAMLSTKHPPGTMGIHVVLALLTFKPWRLLLPKAAVEGLPVLLDEMRRDEAQAANLMHTELALEEAALARLAARGVPVSPAGSPHHAL